MANNEVSIQISVEEKAALSALTKLTKSTEEFGSKTEKSVKKADSAFAVFAGNVAANVASFAFNKVVDGFKAIGGQIGTVTNLAGVQESAVNRLNNQLALTGDFSTDASLEMQKFASELQKTTKFGDEVVLNQLALAKSFGATNDQAKQVVSAAADMAASLGIDLASATRNVAKTLGGYAGELGETIPALKGLTQAQLQAGEGINLLASRFAGAAQGDIQTFDGAIEQLKNTLGDTGESFGSFITENDAVRASITGLGKVFVGLQDFLNSNKDAVNSFVTDGVLKLIDGFKFASDAIITFTNAIASIKNFFDFITVAAFEVSIKFSEFGIKLAETASSIASFFGASTENIDAFTSSLKTSIEATNEAISITEQQTLDRIAAQEEFATAFEEISDKVQTTIKNEVQTAIKEEDKKTKNFIDNLKKRSTEVAKDNAIQKKQQADMTAYDRATKEERIANLQSSLGQISTLTASNNSKLFAIGKASALANAVISGQEAIQKALAAAPPPFNFALAAAVGAAQAVQISKIASQKPPAFAQGGIVPGSSFTGDKVSALVNSGEMILNRQQQQNLLNQLNTGNNNNSNKQVNDIVRAVQSQPIIVQVDGREIARAVRIQTREGFAI